MGGAPPPPLDFAPQGVKKGQKSGPGGGVVTPPPGTDLGPFCSPEDQRPGGGERGPTHYLIRSGGSESASRPSAREGEADTREAEAESAPGDSAANDGSGTLGANLDG